MIRFTRLFPLWAVLASALAWYLPQPIAAGKPAIVPLLGLVMFGMGITLTPASFQAVWRRPLSVLVGLGLQFLLMPLLGWGIGIVFGLAPALIVGMVLVGSCPGGTASNVICYLARGDVALSITLTACSTLLAILATPVLTLVYAGKMVPVPALGMLLTILKIVLVPVLLGMLVNRVLGSRLAGVKRVFPAVSVAAIVVIIAIIVALNRAQFAQLALPLVAAVIAHNLAGLLGGYGLARLLGREVREARTLAIEVGMQNSGLAVALAMQYFSPLAALPGALFSLWHNLSGSLLAGYWARRARQ